MAPGPAETDFVLATTRVGAPARVPEVRLHLAEAAIALNSRLNGVEVARVPGDLLDGETGAAGAQVVLAGDVFYERSLAERMLPFLERVRAGGADVLIGDPSRDFLPRGRLEALATYEGPGTQDLEGTTSERSTVWMLGA